MRVVGRYAVRVVMVALAGVMLAACAGPGAGRTPSAAPQAPAGAEAGTTAAGGSSGPASPAARVRAAFVVIGGPVLPAWIAKDRGLYEKYGLDVELTYIA